MNPIEQLLQAAHGHQGLPAQINVPPGGPSPPSGPPGGGLPPGLPMPGGLAGPGGPPPMAGGSSGGSDHQVATEAAQHLLQATAEAHDPALKQSLSVALAALHKYLAQIDKEHHQAMAGKLSPRLMAQAHGNG